MAASESPYPIQGILVPPGQPPPLRRNFNDWSTNYEQSIPVSLFIRALQQWYSMDYDNMLSYFRIAAIHGYPQNLGWNGVTNSSIFCAHAVITFPTWHRPYMLLFEQRVHELMVEVINELSFPVDTEKQTWLDTASQWRLPYWDWGLPSTAGHIPGLFAMPSIAIRQPLDVAGAMPTTLTVTNPLMRYQVQTGSPKVPTAMGTLPLPYTVNDVVFKDKQGHVILTLPWSECAGTSRWGIKDGVDKSEWMLGINNWQGCNDAIDGHQYEDKGASINSATISDLCYRILAPGYAQNWQTFATTGKDRKSLPTTDWLKYLSLEYIHNNLHGFIGGDIWSDGIGHMENVPSAAFDPIFFMHHWYGSLDVFGKAKTEADLGSNIDRLIAIYQTLYPKNWFLPSDNPPSDAPLAPFYHSFLEDLVPTTRLFTSDDVSDWTKYGYQYDVLERQSGESQDQYIARINTWVKSQYGGTAALLLNDSKGLFRDPGIQNHTYHDYIIDVIYDRHALGGEPYTILFHIGEFLEQEISTRTAALTQDSRFVGSVYNFSSPMVGADGQRACNNCDEQAAAGSLSTAQIPLTRTLYYRAADASITELDQMSPDQVEAYLEKHLHWVVVSASGQVVRDEDVPDTKVFVLKGSAQHFHAAEQPSVYGGYSGMPRVTQNKPGGAAPHEYGE